MAASILQPLDKKSAGLAFLLGLATILGALGSQFIGGLTPCELCLEQRLAYYWGLPVLAAVLVLWNRLPLAVWYVAIGIATAIFAWGAYMGIYHAGVEWGFWPGPTACTGTGTGDEGDTSATPAAATDASKDSSATASASSPAFGASSGASAGCSTSTPDPGV